MDFQRFVALIADKGLWFTKASQYEDPYEVYCHVTSDNSLEDKKSWRSLQKSGESQTVTVQQMGAHIRAMAGEYFEKAPEHLYINSWCLGEESMAMWEIYGCLGRGIAVKSSVARYRRSTIWPEQLKPEQYSCGAVEYSDDIGPGSVREINLTEGRPIPMPGSGIWEKLHKAGLYKRKCFLHENEWRSTLYQEMRRKCTGCNIPVDVNELIDEIVTGPRSDGLLCSVIKSVIDKFEINKPVRRSELLSPLKVRRRRGNKPR
jgi:hypothetical protein